MRDFEPDARKIVKPLLMSASGFFGLLHCVSGNITHHGFGQVFAIRLVFAVQRESLLGLLQDVARESSHGLLFIGDRLAEVALFGISGGEGVDDEVVFPLRQITRQAARSYRLLPISERIFLKCRPQPRDGV
jgi:hypothetical protein